MKIEVYSKPRCDMLDSFGLYQVPSPLGKDPAKYNSGIKQQEAAEDIWLLGDNVGVVSGSKPIVAERLRPSNGPGSQWRGASWRGSKPTGRDFGKDQWIGRSQRMASIAVANFQYYYQITAGCSWDGLNKRSKAPCTARIFSAAKAWLASQRNTAIVGVVSIAVCAEGLDGAMTSTLGRCGEASAALIGCTRQKAGT